ncbi:MAG TPA: hypothetical protein VMW20_10900 [Candidatus Nanoarchaeia archaeon]|nr:hypothetical protein [Candidatus Nanoarchaeia archaeon]
MIDNCPMFTDEKCMANDLLLCDFQGNDFHDCMRYKVKNLSTEFTQLR